MYIINRIYLRPHTTQTAYEVWKGIKPNLSHFHIFGSRCNTVNDRDYLGKFQLKSDEGVFLGYSKNSRAYKVYNKRTKVFTDSINIVVNDDVDFCCLG